MSSRPGSSAVADLIDAPTLAERLERLTDAGLADEAGLAWGLDRVEELVHSDPTTADGLGWLCDAAAEPLGLHAVCARARYLLARIRAERGELGEALELIEDARARWWKTGDHVAALRTDLGRMQVLDDLGRHAEAGQVADALVGALDELAPDPDDEDRRTWLRAAALENLGVSCGYTGDHERALDAYVRAENAYRALGMHAETARPQANRGWALVDLGRPREGLDALRAAAAAFEQAGDRLWWAQCGAHMARAHAQLGEMVDALRLLEQARAALDELGADAEAARTQWAVASVYLTIGLYDEAHTEAQAAAERTQAGGMVHDAAEARFAMALADLNRGMYDSARYELDTAGSMFEQVGDRHQRERVRLAEADIAAATARPADALALTTAAAAALEQGGWHVALAWAELRLADLAADAADAAAHLERALQIADRLALPQLRDPHRLRAARLDRRQGRVDAAESRLHAAIEEVERVGTTLPDHAMRTAFRADRQSAYDELVDLLVERGRPGDVARAFNVAGQARSQTLIDLVRGTIGRRHRVAGDTESGELADHQADLNATYGELLNSPDPARRRLLVARADQLERQLSAARLRHPGTGPASNSRPQPPLAQGGRAELERATPAAAPILAYHVVGDDIIAFVVRGNDVEARRLPGVLPQVGIELDQLATQWSRFRLGSRFAERHHAALVATTRDHLQTLHRQLVAPLSGALDTSGADGLVVMPHRRLHEVPFHCLHDGATYMAERGAVTVGAATGDRRPAQRVGRDALVLAVPDALAPAIAAEATALGRCLPHSVVLIGDDARFGALTSRVPGPGLIHLACHGLYRSGNPLFSSLRMADRWVQAAEVVDLELDGALVTLSACESGRQGAAAEPVGLAWAFLAAGASGAVVSQWVVHDDVTAELMAEFYRNLTAGNGPAHALQTAQLAIAADHPHPYHWAPFTFVTTPSPTVHWSQP